MRIDNPSKEKLREYNDNLFNYITKNNSDVNVLYLDLGVKKVKLVCYSKLFIPHIQKQLDFSLCDKPDKIDATIVLWNEKNIDELVKHISDDFNPRNNLRLRVDMLVLKIKVLDLQVFDKTYSSNKPIMNIDINSRIVNSYDSENETYFYGVENLESEEFIKYGHIFVQILNNILKTDNTNLVHGACIGLDNKGILFCARGQRGKSTLAVLAMMQGFEYVSDDYLTLEKDGSTLYAHPIYSIITLSPRMYNELYDRLDGTRFVANNARKDKYVINISNFHNQFKKKYPVKLCMFPEIVPDEEPSIKLCTKEEKGRAIVHLVHSTVFQMFDKHDMKTIKKIMNMVKKFDFYKINLCNDIYKNVECLKTFIKEYENG